MSNTLLVLMLICTVWLCPAKSEVVVHRLGNEDGLANNTLYDIVQDEEGYIWLATTESGLQRYDGYRFMTFDVLEQNESLNGIQPDVGKLLIDKKQRLWAGTWGLGVSRLSADRSTLTRFNLDGLQVQHLFEAADGSIWVGSTNGLYRIAPDDSVQRIGAPNSPNAFNHQRIWGITKGKNTELWIATSEGFYAWRPDTGLSSPILLKPDAEPGSRENEIRAILYHQGQLWLGTRQGISLFDPDKQSFTSLKRPSAELNGDEFIINLFYRDNNNNLLIGSYEGLYRYSFDCQCFTAFKTQHALLPTLNIRAIFKDRSGVLWLGTRSHGLFYTRYGENTFSALHHSEVEALTKNYALSVTNMLFTTDDTLWLSSGQSLHQLNLADDTSELFKLDSAINKIAKDDNNTLYVATDQGVFFKTEQDNQLQNLTQPFELAGLNRPLIRDMLVASANGFWFGLWGNGVLFYNKNTGTTRHFLAELSEHHSGDAVEAMSMMSDGTVWVGTRYSGLYQLDEKDGIKARLQQDASTTLPSDKIQCLENDGATLLLICTNRGLVLWDLDTDSKRFLDERDGLASNNIVGVVAENKRIWVLTGQGISLISPDINHIVTFDRRDGLITRELNSNAKAIDSQGVVYFGTLQGVMRVDPRYIWTNTQLPNPKITAVKINHGIARSVEPFSDKPLLLAPDENTIEFQFSAMDYHDVSRNSYRYRLSGTDNDWVYAGNRPFTVYSNLQPGNYELQLMAMNNHGLISDHVAKFRFQIEPRWWQRWQVQFSAGLLLLLIIVAIHRYRMRHIHQINHLLNLAVEEKSNSQRVLEQKVDQRTAELQEKTIALENSLKDLADKNNELTRLDKLKDQFVSTVSHELRTPLTAIRGAITLLANHAVDYKSDAYNTMLNVAQLNGERLSQLISDLLDLQKFDSGNFTIQPVKFDLNQLTQDAIVGIEHYAKRFDINIRCAHANAECWVQADPLRIRQVMDNFLSNAIKFSHAGQTVEVTVVSSQGGYDWSVIDSGRGISADFAKSIFSNFSQEDASNERNREGSGLGLAISKKIIDSHGGKIGFSSEPGKGSTFWFFLPSSG